MATASKTKVRVGSAFHARRTRGKRPLPIRRVGCSDDEVDTRPGVCGQFAGKVAPIGFDALRTRHQPRRTPDKIAITLGQAAATGCDSVITTGIESGKCGRRRSRQRAVKSSRRRTKEIQNVGISTAAAAVAIDAAAGEALEAVAVVETPCGPGFPNL